MSDLDDEESQPTPRLTGSYQSFRLESGRMAAECGALASILERVPARYDVQGSKLLRELEADFDYLCQRFGLWPTIKGEHILAKERATLPFELAECVRRWFALKAIYNRADTTKHEPRRDAASRSAPVQGPGPDQRPTVPALRAPGNPYGSRRDKGGSGHGQGT